MYIVLYSHTKLTLPALKNARSFPLLQIVECFEKTKTKKSMRSYLQDVVEHRQEMFRKRSLSTPGTDEQEIPEYNSSYLRHEKLKHVKRLSLPSLSPECGRHLSDAAQALHLST